MLRTNSLRILLLTGFCAAGLVAQDFPQPAIADAPDQGAPASSDIPARTPYNDPPPPPAGAAAPAYGNIPATLTMQSGASVTVRVNQWLSSDRNQTGDTFYATLVQPLIVDGIVVARKGSTVMGRVSEVKKSHVDGTSRLGLELTSLSLVDGRQVSIQSQVMNRNGTTTSTGNQVGAIGATTAVGAGIGAAAGGGAGAGVGAGVGLVAGSIGVLLTRGHPTEIYPESMLTFQLSAPVAINTTNATAAFHYADQSDYGMAGGPPARVASQAPPRPVAGPVPVYQPYPYYEPYYYSPYVYGPGVGVYVGPGFYGGFRGGFRRW